MRTCSGKRDPEALRRGTPTSRRYSMGLPTRFPYTPTTDSNTTFATCTVFTYCTLTRKVPVFSHTSNRLGSVCTAMFPQHILQAELSQCVNDGQCLRA